VYWVISTIIDFTIIELKYKIQYEKKKLFIGKKEKKGNIKALQLLKSIIPPEITTIINKSLIKFNLVK
jgi:hypothetical protein